MPVLQKPGFNGPYPRKTVRILPKMLYPSSQEAHRSHQRLLNVCPPPKPYAKAGLDFKPEHRYIPAKTNTVSNYMPNTATNVHLTHVFTHSLRYSNTYKIIEPTPS